MNKFLIKIVVFSCILGAAFYSITLIHKLKVKAAGAEPTPDYMAAIIDKHRRADSIQSPKILLVGGSNLAFGIDSKMLEDSLGMPVVNMGLHAGLGLNFMLNELKSVMHKNDIVFLSIEYELSCDGDYSLEENVAGFYPSARQFYSSSISVRCNNLYLKRIAVINKNRRILKALIAGTDTIVNNADTLNPVYARKGFNIYGDVIGHLNKKGAKELKDRSTMTYKYWNGIDAINEFSAYAKTKNVQVFFFYPDLVSSDYYPNEKVIKHLALDIQDGLNVPILNTPTDFVYPDSCFFDTVYHLNGFGRKQHTTKMIALIKKNAYAEKSIALNKTL